MKDPWTEFKERLKNGDNPDSPMLHQTIFDPGAQLRHANLRYAYLRGANLTHADLEGADLSDADLHDANLRYARLYMADLRGTRLHKAKLLGTNMYGANFEGARLPGADLQCANLHAANFEGAILPGADLRGASLYMANFRRADLSHAKLRDADLFGAKLQDADLSQADLQYTILVGADLQGANLCQTDLQEAYLENADLRGADLSHAKLKGARLVGADLQGADLSRANLKGANLMNVRLDEHTNLEDVTWDDDHKSVLEREGKYKEAQTIYRHLKMRIQARGDYGIAGEFHYREWECKRKMAWWHESKWEAVRLLIPRFLFGYGERVWRVAITAAFVMIGFTAIYFPYSRSFCFDGQCWQQFGIALGKALYFSGVSFTAVGYGEWVKTQDTTVFRYLGFLESLFGVLLTALFLVTLTKKMMRY